MIFCRVKWIVKHDFSHSQDNNGTIENEELRGFLKDLLELVKKVIRCCSIFIVIDLICLNDYWNLFQQF